MDRVEIVARWVFVIGRDGPADPMGAAAVLHGGLDRGGHLGMGLGGANLLTGSAFEFNHEKRRGGILSFWSRGAQSQFAGREGLIIALGLLFAL